MKQRRAESLALPPLSPLSPPRGCASLLGKLRVAKVGLSDSWLSKPEEVLMSQRSHMGLRLVQKRWPHSNRRQQQVFRQGHCHTGELLLFFTLPSPDTRLSQDTRTSHSTSMILACTLPRIAVLRLPGMPRTFRRFALGLEKRPRRQRTKARTGKAPAPNLRV